MVNNEKEIIKEARQRANEATALCNEIQEKVFRELFGIKAAYELDKPKKIETYTKEIKQWAPRKIEYAFEKIQEYKEKLATYVKDKGLEKYEPQVSRRVRKYVERLMLLEGSIFSK